MGHSEALPGALRLSDGSELGWTARWSHDRVVAPLVPEGNFATKIAAALHPGTSAATTRSCDHLAVHLSSEPSESRKGGQKCFRVIHTDPK